MKQFENVLWTSTTKLFNKLQKNIKYVYPYDIAIVNTVILRVSF